MRREKNALKNSVVHVVFHTNEELIDFVEKENLSIYSSDGLDGREIPIEDINKAILSFDEIDDVGNRIYLPYILMMVRENCEHKPTFALKAIRNYKVNLLLDGKEENTTTKDM